MPQLFPPYADTVARFVLVAIVVMPFPAIGVAYWVSASEYVTGRSLTYDQPIPFSHAHHVGGLGLDCRYCHTGVETSAVAGIPPTHTCMTCHSQLYTQTAMLAPVRESLANGQPIHWNKVNKLPDYVYFDHSIHIAKGVGCTTCHGDVGAYAADAAGRAAHHGLVPRLPSRSGAEPSAGCRGFRSGLEIAGRPGAARTDAGPPSNRQQTSHRLFRVSPMSAQQSDIRAWIAARR